MKTILICILLIGCSKNERFERELDTESEINSEVDSDTGVIIEQYPKENWGYKPAVHTINGSLSKGYGDVLPYISIGGLSPSEKIWQSDTDLEPIIWSIRDCLPCTLLYGTMERGYVMVLGSVWDDVVELQHMYPNLMFVADATWHYGIPWDLDCWPGTVRGFPTIQWIDTETMEIAFEQIGYDPEIQETEFAKKRDIWRGTR